VEKPVENVENYEFSTGILIVSTPPPSCGKEAVSGLHNTPECHSLLVLRHRHAEDSSCQNETKKLGCCEKMLSKTGLPPAFQKNICANQTKKFSVSSCPCWKYFSGKHFTTGGILCPEKWKSAV
jgi:hypothetical protein